MRKILLLLALVAIVASSAACGSWRDPCKDPCDVDPCNPCNQPNPCAMPCPPMNPCAPC